MTIPSVPAAEVIDRYLALLQTPDTVLVGGQAVAYWAEHLGVTPGRPAITRDIDLYGMRADVEEVSGRLGAVPHRTRLATFDDATVNSGTIVMRPPELAEPLSVDYLHSVYGVSGADLQERAVELAVGPLTVRVMHPLMLLESKVINLAAFPSRRAGTGLEQATLAVRIMAAFTERYAAYGGTGRRAFLDLAERVGRLARADAAHFSFHVFGLDVLAAIPVGEVPSGDEFVRLRWPQIQAHAAERRARFLRGLPSPPTPGNTQHLRFA